MHVQLAHAMGLGECILRCGGSDSFFLNDFGEDLLCGCDVSWTVIIAHVWKTLFVPLSYSLWLVAYIDVYLQ